MTITANVSGIGSAPTDRLLADIVATAITRTIETVTATRHGTGPDPAPPPPPVIVSVTS